MHPRGSGRNHLIGLGAIACVALAGVAGCGQGPAPTSSLPLPLPGKYQLVPTNVSFVTPATNYESGTFAKFSVLNMGPATAPDRAYTLDLYIDGELRSFNHASTFIWPGYTTDYSHEIPLKPGRHAYHLIIVQLTTPTPRAELEITTNECAGFFDVREKSHKQ